MHETQGPLRGFYHNVRPRKQVPDAGRHPPTRALQLQKKIKSTWISSKPHHSRPLATGLSNHIMHITSQKPKNDHKIKLLHIVKVIVSNCRFLLKPYHCFPSPPSLTAIITFVLSSPSFTAFTDPLTTTTRMPNPN